MEEAFNVPCSLLRHSGIQPYKTTETKRQPTYKTMQE